MPGCPFEPSVYLPCNMFHSTVCTSTHGLVVMYYLLLLNVEDMFQCKQSPQLEGTHLRLEFPLIVHGSSSWTIHRATLDFA